MDVSVKKILLGVCDIGNGHISRQKCIIKELLKCNVELILAVTDNSIRKFDYEFPEIEKIMMSKELPKNLTYPDTYKLFFEIVINKIKDLDF